MLRKLLAVVFALFFLTAASDAVTGPRRVLLLSGSKLQPVPTTGTCTGGIFAVSGATTVITFTSSGSLNCSISFPAQVLVVAGGGGGAEGGGGAGGYCTTVGTPTCSLGASFTIPSGSTTVTVGAAGTAGSASVTGGNGGNSVLASITATGGGGGAITNGNGSAGGSGGGAGASAAAHTGGAGSQGFSGGANSAGGIFPAGGGGGATATAGAPTTTVGGAGGAGASNSITGAAVNYAGGGGGGVFNGGGSNSAGGVGGGGVGGAFPGVGGAGTPNTGGGGGGVGNTGSGGTGGSGIVIISCATAQCASTTVQLVFEGDSITFGQACAAPTNYPSVATSQLPAGAYFNNTIATSGISSLTLATNYSTRGGAAFNSSYTTNMLMFMAGTNTSGSTDVNDVQKYLLNRSYLRSARNTGYQRIELGTDIARDDDAGVTWTTVLVPLNVNQRALYNSDMQADGLMDWGVSTFFSPASAADNTSIYFTDKVHPVAGGCTQLANIASPVMTTNLTAPGTRTFAPATWSPFQTATSIGDGNAALSNSNRTISVPSGTGTFVSRSFPGAYSGKIYAEATLTIQSGVAVGIATDSFLFIGSAGIGSNASSLGYNASGAVLVNGATIGTGSTFITLDTIRIAADFSAKLVWFQRCRAGVCQSWNADGSADPTTGVGGFSFSSLPITGAGDRFYFAGQLTTGLDAITSAFATSQQAFATPSGYSTFAP